MKTNTSEQTKRDKWHDVEEHLSEYLTADLKWEPYVFEFVSY